MRVAYVPISDKVWANHYCNQAGGGFVGLPYQRGGGLGSFFRGIFRALLPIAKSAGKAVGKQALATGAQIASDVVAGKNVKAAAQLRTRRGASKLLRKAAVRLQRGRGLGRRKKAKATKPIKRRRKRAVKRKKTTKRAAKRRRLTDQLGAYYK